jgi:phosphoribosylformylglycinamidine synthase
MVRTNTIGMPGIGAGVVRIKGTDRALALSVDGNGRSCYLDPYEGAAQAVAEAARNVACAGAEPIGATNCLNAGNPERPEIMWQFAQMVDGISAACRALDVPITGGNVSLYNETDGRPIYPTPVIGVVGLIEHASHIAGRVFPAPDLVVLELGCQPPSLGGSEYLKLVHSLVRGRPAPIDFTVERALQQLVIRGIREGVIESAHDCSDGGIAVTLAECCFGGDGVGVDVDLPAGGELRTDWVTLTVLFGESPSRVVVSASAEHAQTLLGWAAACGVPARIIGRTGGARVRIAVNGRNAIDLAVADAGMIWSHALEQHFERRVA